MYTVTPPAPPLTPTFASAERSPSLERNRKENVEQRIVLAVNTAMNITDRIEKNIKMLRMARAAMRTTGNCFQSLVQTPIDHKAFTKPSGSGHRQAKPPLPPPDLEGL
jgi:hypothetical protein